MDKEIKMDKLTGSEAIIGFLAWLTTREVSVTFGARHDSGIAVDLGNRFCEENELEMPRKKWVDNLRIPPVSVEG